MLRDSQFSYFKQQTTILLGSDLKELLRERCRRDRVSSVVKAAAKKVYTKLQAMTTVATHRLNYMYI